MAAWLPRSRRWAGWVGRKLIHIHLCHHAYTPSIVEVRWVRVATDKGPPSQRDGSEHPVEISRGGQCPRRSVGRKYEASIRRGLEGNGSDSPGLMS